MFSNALREFVFVFTSMVSQLLTNVAEPAIQSVVLKHVHQLVPYCVGFPKISKFILKVTASVRSCQPFRPHVWVADSWGFKHFFGRSGWY